MNRIRGKRLVLLIGTFLFLYFIYAGSQIHSQISQNLQKTKTDIENNELNEIYVSRHGICKFKF